MREIDNYFDNKPEPVLSCLDALRQVVVGYSPAVTEVWRYKMPFYCFSGKRFCYLWVDQKRNLPYIGFVDGNLIQHPDLLQEKRSRMKILLIDPNEDLPVQKITSLFQEAISLLR